MTTFSQDIPFHEIFKQPDCPVEPVAADNMSELYEALGSELLVAGSRVLSGQAFIQGNRLDFSTSVPVQTLLEISFVDRAIKGATLDEAVVHTNRPKLPQNSGNLRRYTLETACAGQPFFFPNFTLNYGIGYDPDNPEQSIPRAKLYFVKERLLGGIAKGAVQCFLCLPPVKMRTTDGGHRHKTFDEILDPKSKDVSSEKRNALLSNFMGVTVIFEPSMVQAHQDFADAAKSQPITKGLVTAYDQRDSRNILTMQLVRDIPFLSHFVDATAGGINLSSRSLKVWSLSAVRLGFVETVQNLALQHEAEKQGDLFIYAKAAGDPKLVKERMAGAVEFLSAVIKHVEPLNDLEQRRIANNFVELDGEKPHNAGTLRDINGGDFVLRGGFLAICAHAFHWARLHDIPLEEVAKALGGIEWHILDISKEALDDEVKANERETDETKKKSYYDILKPHIRDHLVPLVNISTSRYKITPTAGDIKAAWRTELERKVLKELQNVPQLRSITVKAEFTEAAE